MNKSYFKEFLHRGLIFGGFGPIVAGIVYFAISLNIKDFSVSGAEILTATVSIYLLAFVHAGSSVFHQIEEWSAAKAMLCQLGLLYAAYTLCYLINSWIKPDPTVILIYTLIFVAVYIVIWGSIYLTVKMKSKKMNRVLK